MRMAFVGFLIKYYHVKYLGLFRHSLSGIRESTIEMIYYNKSVNAITYICHKLRGD